MNRLDALHDAARQFDAAETLPAIANVAGELAHAFEVATDPEGAALRRMLTALAGALAAAEDDQDELLAAFSAASAEDTKPEASAEDTKSEAAQ
jgi:hypothetical protein